jgi:NAD(P)H-flavin reductase/ferredoxin
MATITIEQWGKPIECGKQRILDAALDAGVPYPHGCASGECGTCKSQVISGEVVMDRYSPGALTDAEKAQGQILACRARCTTNATVRWLSAADTSNAIQNIHAKVIRVRELAHDVMSLQVESTGIHFKPGQFAKIKIGTLPQRSYSMAGLPSDEHVEFHVRVLPNGAVSQHIAKTVRTGEVIQIQAAFGEATWDKNLAPEGKLLLLAGGTGMAPILSILRAALNDGFPGDKIHVFHGVRSSKDAYASIQLQALAKLHGFEFNTICSDEVVDGKPAALLHQAVASIYPRLSHAQVFTAGPPPMVQAVVSLTREWGLAPDRVRADAFYAADIEPQNEASDTTSVPAKKGFLQRVMGWR